MRMLLVLAVACAGEQPTLAPTGPCTEVMATGTDNFCEPQCNAWDPNMPLPACDGTFLSDHGTGIGNCANSFTNSVDGTTGCCVAILEIARNETDWYWARCH